MAVFVTLDAALNGGFTTKSKFARDMATIVAICATEQLITTKVADERWGNLWMLTEYGYEYYKEIEDAIDIEDITD